MARLIVLESVLRNDREGDLAGVLTVKTPSSSEQVFGLVGSAGVRGICGVRGEGPGEGFGVCALFRFASDAVSKSGRLERLGTRALGSESLEPRPSRDFRRAPSAPSAPSAATSCLLRRWSSKSTPQSERSVTRVISSVTGWYDDEATYIEPASRRSARPAAPSSSAISARAESDKSQSSPKKSPAFSVERAPSAVTRSTSPSSMTCIARPRPSARLDVFVTRLPSTYGVTGTQNSSAATSLLVIFPTTPGPANASPGRRAALPDHNAFSRSSFASGGAGRNVSTTFRTFASNRRARWIRARTIRLNVSPETANARVATPSRSPFSDTTRAVVR